MWQAFFAALSLHMGDAIAAGSVYLTCTVPSDDGSEPRVFHFTLDEATSTVTYYVQDANATNVEKAVFGPTTITWVRNSEYLSVTRTINRVDLSFDEEVDVAGTGHHAKGTCQVDAPVKRKI